MKDGNAGETQNKGKVTKDTSKYEVRTTTIFLNTIIISSRTMMKILLKFVSHYPHLIVSTINKLSHIQVIWGGVGGNHARNFPVPVVNLYFRAQVNGINLSRTSQ